MIVVGGTYSEVCFEPRWEQIYGSGFRAVNLLLEANREEKIHYYTCGDEEISSHLDYYKGIYPNFQVTLTDVKKSPEFIYEHPLGIPRIFPRLDLLLESSRTITVNGDNILAFGLIEAKIEVNGEKVVYDPQSPVNPIPFSKTGSTSKHLVMVINLSEAKLMAGACDVEEIKNYFFSFEKCHALVLKMGAKGALLYESQNAPPTRIPVYETNSAWTIGSGDVFSAAFAKNWFDGKTLSESALVASKTTAAYSNSANLSVLNGVDQNDFRELVLKNETMGQVYLAGPFFTMQDRWMLNQAYTALKGFGLSVFSPFHDVGYGSAKDVVDKDLKGLNESQIIFAMLDGLDSGTLFEVGYAVSKGIKVIVFVQNEGEESLKMIEGTDCILESDFTTAIYKTYWELGKT